MSETLPEHVGYNYVAALLALLKRMTYRQVCDALGYRSKGALSKILDGAVPKHIHGEALWALYVETFKEKPPMSVRQGIGIQPCAKVDKQ